MTVIAAYDISSDRRRGRLAAEFQGWGYRIQESVFQLRVESADLEVLRGRIRDIIKESDDVVHLCLLCTSCAGRVEVCGTAPVLDDGGLYRRGSGDGAWCGARGVEASRACGLGHHQCGAGHPSRLPLFRMISSRAGAGSALGAVGGEWRHTNERW